MEHHGQKIRTRNFQARNKRIETGALVKTQKGKNVSVERTTGHCHQWQAKGQCSKGDACSVRHDDMRGGKKARSFSLAPRPQAQNDGKKKTFERKVSQRPLSFWKETSKCVQTFP